MIEIDKQREKNLFWFYFGRCHPKVLGYISQRKGGVVSNYYTIIITKMK